MAAQAAEAAGEAGAAVVEVLSAAGEAAEQGASDAAANALALAQQVAERATHIAERAAQQAGRTAAVLRTVVVDPIDFLRELLLSVRTGVVASGKQVAEQVRREAERYGRFAEREAERAASRGGKNLSGAFRLLFGDEITQVAEQVAGEVVAVLANGAKGLWGAVEGLLGERGVATRSQQSTPPSRGSTPHAGRNSHRSNRLMHLRARLVQTESAVRLIRSRAPFAEAAHTSRFCWLVGVAGWSLRDRSSSGRITHGQIAILQEHAMRTVLAAQATTRQCEALLDAIERWRKSRKTPLRRAPIRARPKKR